MKAIADLTISALRDVGLPEMPHYAAYLSATCEEVPLAFGARAYGERYREMALDARWFMSSLASNTAKEAEGAERIWEMASRTQDERIRGYLLRHARDEAGHARLYIEMLELAFPDRIPQDTLTRLNDMLPTYASDYCPELQDVFTPEEAILDELIQMNIGEIRTRIHQLLLRPVIQAFCPPENAQRLEEILDRIIHEETHHVGYTAKLINEAIIAGEGDWVRNIMKMRWAEFDDITKVEQERAVFH